MARADVCEHRYRLFAGSFGQPLAKNRYAATGFGDHRLSSFHYRVFIPDFRPGPDSHPAADRTGATVSELHSARPGTSQATTPELPAPDLRRTDTGNHQPTRSGDGGMGSAGPELVTRLGSQCDQPDCLSGAGPGPHILPAQGQRPDDWLADQLPAQGAHPGEPGVDRVRGANRQLRTRQGDGDNHCRFGHVHHLHHP